MERGKKVKMMAANAGGLNDILPLFDDGPPVRARRAVPLPGGYRRRPMACSLPPVTRHLLLAASLLATPFLSLATPVHAADITIDGSGGPVSNPVFGNSTDNGVTADQPANGNSITVNTGATVSGIVYGGYANDSIPITGTTANKNTVTINGGTINSGIVSGGFASGDTATANDNIVSINSGAVNIGVLIGGQAGSVSATGTATASNNTVTISGGTVDNVYGGDALSYTATANSNTVTISGGTVHNVSGGFATGSTAATASNNTVTISGGTLNNVYGGFADGGTSTASGNTIVIRGGTISGAVIGGLVDTGAGIDAVTAQKNIITIEGSSPLDMSQATVAGGFGFLNLTGVTQAQIDKNIMTGNIFNLKRSGVTVAGLAGFQNLNFYLPTTLGNGGTMLTVTGEAAINGSQVEVSIQGDSSPLRAGDKVNLINAGTLTGTPANNGGISRGTGMQGVTWLYDFKVYTQGNQLIAEVEGNQVPPTTPSQSSAVNNNNPPPPNNPPIKALTTGSVAPLTTVNQGLTFTSTKGIDQAVQAASSPGGGSSSSSSGGSSSSDSNSGGGQEGGEKGVGGVAGVMQSSTGARPFGAISGGHMSYDTGASVDVDSISLIAGLSKAVEYQRLGRLTLGGFLEYGHASYDTDTSFTNQPSVHGSGNIDNFGVGILGRLDLRQLGEGISAGRFYADASARLGQVRSDFASVLYQWDKPDNRVPVSFDTDSIYFGGHLGSGYLMAVSNTSQADFYARLLWTHQNGDDVQLSTGETYNFDAVNSLRTMLGARYTWVAKSWLVPYVGAGWEHEFDGEASSSVKGYENSKTSLDGDTGMGEIGLNMGSNAGKWAFDVGAQGYVGAREGVSGTVRVVYRW